MKKVGKFVTTYLLLMIVVAFARVVADASLKNFLEAVRYLIYFCILSLSIFLDRYSSNKHSFLAFLYLFVEACLVNLPF